MSAGNEHVDGRHHEQRERSSDDHAADQHNADAVARACSGTGGEDEREVAEDGGGGGHEDWTQTGAGSFRDRVKLVQATFLQVVGKFNDKNPVF